MEIKLLGRWKTVTLTGFHGCPATAGGEVP